MTYWLGNVSSNDGRRQAHWLFSSRMGGTSRAPFDDWNLAFHVGDTEQAVDTNRALVAQRAELPAQRLVFMRQCHSAEVTVVDDDSPQEVVGVDGLVTATSGLGVVALAADCVPVALVDPDAGVVAAVHSGWQGMVADVVGAALEAMVAAGASTDGIRAALGPAICGACYPVPPQRAEQAADAWPDSLAQAPDGQPAIDVRAGLAQRLTSAGVRYEYVGGCTAEDPHLFSYRRDGVTGRQGVAVWWTPQ